MDRDIRTSFKGLVIAGVIGGEVAGANLLHDHVLYPREVARANEVTGQINHLTANAGQMSHAIGVLTAQERVFTQYHEPVPIALSVPLAADKATLKSDQTITATLAREYPSMPITSSELLGAFLLVSVGAALAPGIRRIVRRQRAVSAAIKFAMREHDDPAASPEE